MMESVKKQSFIEFPNGWADIFGRTVITAVVAFVALQLKEYFDAGAFDMATAVDAGLIAGGIFVFNAILKLAKP